MPELNNFALVGGTALSLKLGHRTSVDLDLFSNEKIDREEIARALELEFGEDFVYIKRHIWFAVFCTIQNVKVDIVYSPNVMVAPIETTEGIRIYSNKDIAAMKINAILGRGAKKDFWDIVELLKEFSMDEIIQFHKLKYPSQMLLISIPNALTYFVDADESDDPISLNGQTWEQIKKELRAKVREFLS
jgi:predicted nucleotidyltransferase component of viral defense system